MKNENTENFIKKNTENREHFGAETSGQAAAKTSESRSMEELPEVSRTLLQDILAGRAVPPLYMDIIAKTILNPDTHPERAGFLLREIAQDETIEVRSSAGGEGVRKFLGSKTVIVDIPSWLADDRYADLEMQKVKQEFIFTRMDLYASDMLLLQYSVPIGQEKSTVDYTNVKGVLVVVLMVDSPKFFGEYDRESDRYIHRFTKMTADSGLTYDAKAKTIYVQLDKCLKQFKEGKNAESPDGRPDRLQRWLASLADINDADVEKAISQDPELWTVREEAARMGRDKEVQIMLTQEFFDEMDWNSYRHQWKEEGLEEGRKEGLQEGRKEGLQEGRKEGRKEGAESERARNLQSLMETLGLTQDEAMAALKLTPKPQS